MDLTIQYPRSLRKPLGGYAHLARMIDKCRAVSAGRLGEYIYPCPLDMHLLEFAGLTPEDFLDAVRSRNDQEILRWFQTKSKPHSRREIEVWNQMMLNRGPDSDEKWEYFAKTRDSLDPTRTDITTWVDLLDLDEKRFVPRKTVSPFPN